MLKSFLCSCARCDLGCSRRLSQEAPGCAGSSVCTSDKQIVSSPLSSDAASSAFWGASANLCISSFWPVSSLHCPLIFSTELLRGSALEHLLSTRYDTCILWIVSEYYPALQSQQEENTHRARLLGVLRAAAVLTRLRVFTWIHCHYGTFRPRCINSLPLRLLHRDWSPSIDISHS